MKKHEFQVGEIWKYRFHIGINRGAVLRFRVMSIDRLITIQWLEDNHTFPKNSVGKYSLRDDDCCEMDEVETAKRIIESYN